MNVAILGLGVVGRGVYDLLLENPHIHVTHIVEKDDKKLDGLDGIKPSSFEAVIHDDNVDVIIELIGGKNIAYEFVKQALKAKKHVVTANKALISAYGKELFECARLHQVYLRYEASVAGATIVLAPLQRMTSVNPIHHMYGIMNGTTNYVLTQIFKHGLSKQDAINKAKQLGFIETGSNDDMQGLDSMRKINILSMIAYQTWIDESHILVVPLDTVTQAMMNNLAQEKYQLKYVSMSKKVDDSIHIEVCPVATKNPSMYDHINNEMNIVYVEGMYHEKQAFIGQGAGRYPTATAIISDLKLIAKDYDEPLLLDHTYHINKEPLISTFMIETVEGFYEIKSSIEALNQREDVICFVKVGDS